VRIITRKRLREFGRLHPDARGSLAAWAEVTGAAGWRNLIDVRRDFPTADGVVVRSGRVVTVFNIRGNNYRLITAIHYLNTHPVRGRVYVLRFYTHSEYDKGDWKDDL
jgi:mRNA interferase HigB